MKSSNGKQAGRKLLFLLMVFLFFSAIPVWADETAAETEERAEEEESREEEEKGGAKPAGITPAGNLSLVDDLGGEEPGGRQFITLVSKNGNYFYLIIDRDKEGNENVHFLNLVDERDLLELLKEEDAEEIRVSVAETKEETKKEENAPLIRETEPARTEQSDEQKPSDFKEEVTKQQEKSKIKAVLLVILLTALGICGVFALKKTIKRRKEKRKEDPDGDPDDEGELIFPEEPEEE